MTTGRINQVCTSPPHNYQTKTANALERTVGRMTVAEATTKHSNLNGRGSKTKQRQTTKQGKLTYERFAHERNQQQCCFKLAEKQLDASKMHKLALTDNCTQVLLPTQALSFAIATDSSNSNSHPSQPQPEPSTRVER